MGKGRAVAGGLAKLARKNNREMVQSGQQLSIPRLEDGCILSWAKRDGTKRTRRGQSQGRAPGRVAACF